MIDLDGARRLLRAAGRDLAALHGMTDASVFADEIFGFHAQQAAEKLLKMWLLLQGREHPNTHNIARLVALIQEIEPVEGRFEALNELTAYAVLLRYDAAEPDAQPVNRGETTRTLDALRREIRGRLSKLDR